MLFSAHVIIIIKQQNGDILGEPAPYNTDLNTMTKGGVWMVQTDEDKIEQNNFPQGVVNGWVRVYRNSSGATKQVFYRYGTNDKTDGNVYTRTYNVNSKNWSRWTSYARMSDLDASVKTINLSAGKDVRLFVGELNGSQNYLQFLIDGVDKGYIVFDVSRNINT